MGEIIKFKEAAEETEEVRDYMDQLAARKKKKEKRNIKNSPNKSKKLYKGQKKNRIKAAIAAAIVLIGTVTAGAIISNHIKDKKDTTKTDTKVTKTIDKTKAPSETALNNMIDTPEEVEQDFIDKYLKAYNEVYGTEYMSADLLVSSLKEGVVFETDDGKHVTRGNYPDSTKQTLENEGYTCYKVNGYDKVLQVITPENKVLGTYNMSTGEFIYSGNSETLAEDLQKDPATLENLGINKKLLVSAAEVKQGEMAQESNSSIGQRVSNYADYAEITDDEER